MTAFLFRMPSGIPGNVSRVEGARITAELVLTTNPPIFYGSAVALDVATGKIRPMGTGDVAANFYGAVMRPYPTQGGATGWPNQPTEANGVPGTPFPGGICNVLKSGNISIVCQGATLAAKGAPVYVRVGGATSTLLLGGYEAVIDPTTPANTVKLPNTYFMGAQDAQGNTEIYVFAGNG